MTKFEQIEPDRKQDYLRNASEVFNQVSEAVVKELGAEVVLAATELNIEDAQAAQFVDDISNYKGDHDIKDQWSEVINAPITTGIVEGAERHLQQYTSSFEASPFNVPAPQSQSESDRSETISEIDELIAMGDDDEIHGLTIDKDTAPYRTDSQGALEYQARSGQWISENDVDRAHSRWGTNTAALQKAQWFVDRKSLNSQEKTEE